MKDPKVKSHTQQTAEKAYETIKHICKAANITKSDWLDIMFETGFKRAELKAPTYEIAVLWVTKPDFGYWSWWIAEYINDDEWMLNHSHKYTPAEYINLKMEYINF